MNHDNDIPKEQQEGLSFQDMIEEMGDIPFNVDAEEIALAPLPEPGRDLPGGTVVVDENPSWANPEETISTRILTGCSPQPRPMWVDGLGSSALGLFFLIPILMRSGLRSYQPWISYMIMLLALGGMAWSLLGLQVETSRKGKKWCWSVALMGMVVALVAFFTRGAP